MKVLTGGSLNKSAEMKIWQEMFIKHKWVVNFPHTLTIGLGNDCSTVARSPSLFSVSLLPFFFFIAPGICWSFLCWRISEEYKLGGWANDSLNYCLWNFFHRAGWDTYACGIHTRLNHFSTKSLHRGSDVSIANVRPRVYGWDIHINLPIWMSLFCIYTHTYTQQNTHWLMSCIYTDILRLQVSSTPDAFTIIFRVHTHTFFTLVWVLVFFDGRRHREQCDWCVGMRLWAKQAWLPCVSGFSVYSERHRFFPASASTWMKLLTNISRW